MALVPAEVAPILAKVASALKARGETVAVAESAAGGLISAYLLSVPGASAYYRGGSVLYTLHARQAWAGWTEENVKNYRGPTPEGATLMAAKVGETLQATWTIGETGIAGPTGGKKLPPGYCCFAIVGPVAKAIDFNSGIDDREKNMVVFTRKALELLGEALDEAAPAAAKH